MTDAIAFDTHRFVKHLTASGFTEEQAEIQTVKADLQAEMQAIRADLLKWMVVALTTQTGVLAALFTLL